MRTCNKCLEEKEELEYASFILSTCNKCLDEIIKVNKKEKSKKHIKEYQREYRKNNKIVLSREEKDLYNENRRIKYKEEKKRENKTEKQKTKEQKTKEYQKGYQKEYRETKTEEQKQKKRDSDKIYKAKNRKKINKKSKLAAREKQKKKGIKPSLVRPGKDRDIKDYISACNQQWKDYCALPELKKTDAWKKDLEERREKQMNSKALYQQDKYLNECKKKWANFDREKMNKIIDDNMALEKFIFG